jgi:TPP-dependent pyruvate/acetoin dehydrogenase alpha subunit
MVVVGGTAVVAGVGAAFYNSNSDAGKYVTYAGTGAAEEGQLSQVLRRELPD